jgi:uncharacterized repeat protein (TIGR03837 family)
MRRSVSAAPLPTVSSAPVSCDIFCRVIDNFGDAGICWRLARQLAREYGWQTRLWIDDPAIIDALAPRQDDVDIRRWQEEFTSVTAADVIVEAFACALPSGYIDAMRARPSAPVWLNLDYLSAEDWVAGCHALPSPQAGLRKFFFFPGFVPGTGGLLRERDVAVTTATEESPCGAPSFAGPLEISLFCYENSQLPALLDTWRDGDRPIRCHVCAGLPQGQVASWLGEAFAAGATTRRGALTLHALPFLPQTDYDALLSRCHLNFVRGEDSFVRAQWAERPFIWQAYPQEENVHFAKLDAFLQLYAKLGAPQGLPSVAGVTATCDFFQAWNGRGALDWPAFAAALPALGRQAPVWAAHIAAHGDLARNLVNFCRSRL